MPAGRLRERVRFEAREDVDDGFGNHVASWVSRVGPLAAEIKPMRGNEADETVQAHKLQSQNVFEIKLYDCRAIRCVDSDWRIVNARSGQIYNIRVIQNRDMRNRKRTFICETGVADAQ